MSHPLNDDSRKNHHVVTVGTSIATNARQAGIDLRDVEALRKWVADNHRLASAELNAMDHYLKQGTVSTVYLLCTDTEESRLCADILKWYLEEHGVTVINGPKIQAAPDRSGFYEGLTQMAQAVARYIRRHQAEGLMVNATGGFKAETSLAAALGLFMGVPVYYRHETAQDTVELPPIGLASGETGLALREIPFPEGRLVHTQWKAWRDRHGDAVKRLVASSLITSLPYGVELTEVGRLLRRWLDEVLGDDTKA